MKNVDIIQIASDKIVINGILWTIKTETIYHVLKMQCIYIYVYIYIYI